MLTFMKKSRGKPSPIVWGTYGVNCNDCNAYRIFCPRSVFVVVVYVTMCAWIKSESLYYYEMIYTYSSLCEWASALRQGHYNKWFFLFFSIKMVFFYTDRFNNHSSSSLCEITQTTSWNGLTVNKSSRMHIGAQFNVQCDIQKRLFSGWIEA